MKTKGLENQRESQKFEVGDGTHLHRAFERACHERGGRQRLRSLLPLVLHEVRAALVRESARASGTRGPRRPRRLARRRVIGRLFPRAPLRALPLLPLSLGLACRRGLGLLLLRGIEVLHEQLGGGLEDVLVLLRRLGRGFGRRLPRGLGLLRGLRR